MSTADERIWQQVRTLLNGATDHVRLIAPFIKLEVLRTVLAATPASVQRIDCVTRWSAAEVAAGVSDPEIIYLIQEDERLRVRLCHNLHAKLFLADTAGLVGSANLTRKAFGTTARHNLELLVEVDRDHPEVQHLLQRIDLTAVPATEEMAASVCEQAKLLQETEGASIIVAGEDVPSAAWYPVTRRPDHLYGAYTGKADASSAVRDGYVHDLAFLDVPLGLDEATFNEAVRQRLAAIHEVSRLLKGERLSNLDIQRSLSERIGLEDREARRVAETIAAWLKHFDHFYMNVATWELRPGQEHV
ncbi:hypothetical protein CA850_32615 [Micromonospora echinospora]|uniref:PLD-like domain-containing protein n=1 Tax=Micromonospora echinospora TaxID=1877 RepID=A0A1C4WHI4_MICEC|nr:phospholipase D family protein [Micromonospora echinospora]OZV72161.1 hypothetical protein CA850_32615 [Micromonospora echinospora]SCE95401.1 PLD-like domain-containing protein [Micromonospora echinospora]